LVFTCMPCRAKRPLLRVRAFGRYDGRLREAIHALKYGKHLALADPLGTALAHVVSGDPVLRTADVLVPVPLHPGRWSERGFNQAEELGRVAARRTGIPFRRLVVRMRPTVPQTELDEEERRRNVRGAFAVSGTAAGLRVLLVDDVVTTGSTLRECARALRRAGARDVYAAVVAMTVRDP
jgi:ComF family protein